MEELTLFPFSSLPRIDDNREGNDTPAREPRWFPPGERRRHNAAWWVGLELDVYGNRPEHALPRHEDQGKRRVPFCGIYECARPLQRRKGGDIVWIWQRGGVANTG